MNDLKRECAALLARLRETAPLVHNITNYVTVNDVANAVLAIGGSPIMADDEREAADIASVSAALVLNTGTLNSRTVSSMVQAGRAANSRGIPVALDPVGASASQLRSETVQLLLQEVRVSVLRGNLSELSFAAGLGGETRGVDTGAGDAQNDPAAVAREAALRHGCVAAVTGRVDAVSDGRRLAQIENGHPMLSRVTGTGCMTTALVGAFLGAGGEPFVAAAAGVACMGIAGELAHERAGHLGTGSFHMALLDALSTLTPELLEERGKFCETSC